MKLLDACRKGDLATVRDCVDAGHHRTPEGTLGLREAIEHDLIELAELLVRSETPLDEDVVNSAVKLAPPTLLRDILKRNASTQEALDEALSLAVQNKRVEAARCLIERGADVCAGHGDILAEAAYQMEADIVRLLIESGAEVVLEKAARNLQDEVEPKDPRFEELLRQVHREWEAKKVSDAVDKAQPGDTSSDGGKTGIGL